MHMLILRVAFILVAIGIATLLVDTIVLAGVPVWLPWLFFGGTLAIAGGVMACEIIVPRKPIDAISAVYFGLLVGVFLTYVVMLVLSPLLPGHEQADRLAVGIRTTTSLLVGMVLCYLCISVLVQTKDDFRFIIPYV